MVLDGKPLPWVDNVKYLGSIITNNKEILEQDISAKRAKFINNVNCLIQEFKWAHPSILARINLIYNSNIYGSNLFPLDCEGVMKIFNSYSVATRTIWNVPRETHRYIAEELAGRHLATSMMSNQLNFYRKLESSHKLPVRNLFSIVSEDVRSTTGMNMRLLRNTCIDLGLMRPSDSLSSVNSRHFSQQHRFAVTPESERYRLGILDELLSIRSQYQYFEDDFLTIEDITIMINNICTQW